MQLDGIHHISAMTGDAPGNLDFYTRVMGLRLVAKTVNQDDPTVYHLFYADERGTPGRGADVLRVPGPPAGPRRRGDGAPHRLGGRVGGGARLLAGAPRRRGRGGRAGRGDALRFADPEGLGHELVVRGARPGRCGPSTRRSRPSTPWRASWACAPTRPRPSAAASCCGTCSAPSAPATALGAARPGPRRHDRLDAPPDERRLQGAGTVHHVAWGTTRAEHPAWRARLADAGVRVTPVIDRYYFHSIYFREPSGVLYEIADDGPGFTRDMPVEELGTRVILPPWLEEQRAAVEARLTPLPDPRAGWARS